jgi:hypothetical protein
MVLPLSSMNKDQLLAALYDAVHPNGANGKTTAFGLRGFLSLLVDEVAARPATGPTTGTGTGAGAAPGSGTVLTAPGGLSYRLSVADDGSLHATPTGLGPLPDPSLVLTAPNGLTYRLSVADGGTLRVLPARGLVDPDAQAFIAAAGLVNAAQQEAVNELVIALKIGNVWPRLRALYPMVGGTAQAHALNLLDPRDADEAFRLTFYNNPRHDALGVRWDGVIQYADTHFVPTRLPFNSCHLAYYATTTSPAYPTCIEIGCLDLAANVSLSLLSNFNSGLLQFEFPGGYSRGQVPTALGLSLASHPDGLTAATYRDGRALPVADQQVAANRAYPAVPVLLAHRQDGYFSDRACGLASIGEGLSPAEAAAYAAAVADFERALGRAVGLEAEAVAFAEAAALTDPAQVQAVSALVRDLKAGGIWPLLHALYPLVGGTARAHALNLKDPRDADSAFRLTLHPSIRHTARGLEWAPEAQTSADTHLVPADHLSLSNHHVAYYAVTEGGPGDGVEVGCYQEGSLTIVTREVGGQHRCYVEDCATTQFTDPLAHPLGLTLLSRTSYTELALYRDEQALSLRGSTNANVAAPRASLLLGGRQDGHYTSKTCGLASVGAGFSPAQAHDFAVAVRAYQRALGRDVALAPELLFAYR